MSTVPMIKVPAGFSLVENGDDGWEIVKNAEPMTRTVAFRVTASTYSEALALVESFPDRSWGTALRWLLDDGTVRGVIADRIGRSTKRAQA